MSSLKFNVFLNLKRPYFPLKISIYRMPSGTWLPTRGTMEFSDFGIEFCTNFRVKRALACAYLQSCRKILIEFFIGHADGDSRQLLINRSARPRKVLKGFFEGCSSSHLRHCSNFYVRNEKFYQCRFDALTKYQRSFTTNIDLFPCSALCQWKGYTISNKLR